MNLQKHHLDIWCVNHHHIQDDMLLQYYASQLSADEKERQQRFYFQKDRHRFLVSRALIREVLSLYVTDILPGHWDFDQYHHGKPFIQNSLVVPLYFNLSHTNHLSALVVSLHKDIGIDVEMCNRSIEVTEMAQRIFSTTEINSLNKLSKEDQHHRFFSLWTLKEAFVKADGKGLTQSLSQFSFEFPTANSIKLNIDDKPDQSRLWHLWQLQPDEIHLLALAIRSNNLQDHSWTIRIREIIPHSIHREVHYPVLRSTASTHT